MVNYSRQFDRDFIYDSWSLLAGCATMDRFRNHFRDFYKEVDMFVFGVAVDEELQVWEEEEVWSNGKVIRVKMTEAFTDYLKSNGRIMWSEVYKDHCFCLQFLWKSEVVCELRIPYYSFS